MFLILYVVFVRFLRIGGDIPHYPIYLLLGIVLWNFFSEMTTQSLVSVVGRGDLIRKIKIPRWIIVLSSSVSALINLFLNLLVVAVFMLFNQVDIQLTAVWLPIVLLEIYVLSLGLSLFLSAAYVKYRDISYIWEVIMQGLFYFTPIIYPLSAIPSLEFQKIIILNPMAQAIQDARNILVTPESLTITKVFGSDLVRLAPLAISAAVLFIGIIYFKSQAKYFAEEL